MTDTIVSKDALVGTWKILELKIVDEEQKTSYPYGKNPVGYNIYTQGEYMSSSIMMSNRLKLGLPVEEMRALGYGAKPKLVNTLKYIKAMLRYVQAGNNYAAYTGKYEVRDNKVIHHLEVNIVPDLVGIDSEFSINLSEDKLVLTSTLTTSEWGEYHLYVTLQRVS